LGHHRAQAVDRKDHDVEPRLPFRFVSSLLAVGHGPKRPDDLRQGALFEEVALGSEVHGGVEEVFVVNDEKDDLN
jgi:hypothetical protein